jgi:hypothetical protein
VRRSLRRYITGVSPKESVGVKPLEHLRQTLRIVDLPKNESIRSIVNQIGHAGIHGSNDGKAASHGFRDGQAEGVFAGGADVEIGGAIEIEYIFAKSVGFNEMPRSGVITRFPRCTAVLNYRGSAGVCGSP